MNTYTITITRVSRFAWKASVDAGDGAFATCKHYLTERGARRGAERRVQKNLARDAWKTKANSYTVPAPTRPNNPRATWRP